MSAPLWSLPYEVQMYLLLPAIFLYLQKRKDAAFLWVVGLVIAALPVRMVGPHFKSVVRFFPCFLSGCLAYALTKTRRAALPGFLWPIAILGVLSFYLVASLRFETYAEWAGCLLLGLAIPHFREIDFLRRPAKSVAKYSYGIYLFHMPLIWLCFVMLPRFHWPAFVVLLTTSSVGLYYAVEYPMIRTGARLAAKV